MAPWHPSGSAAASLPKTALDASSLAGPLQDPQSFKQASPSGIYLLSPDEEPWPKMRALRLLCTSRQVPGSFSQELALW